MEAAFHGEGTLSTTFWVSVTYVAEDGAEYGNSYAITPLASQLPWEVSDGTSFSQQTAFLIPQDAPEGGHIVLTPIPPAWISPLAGHLGDCGLPPRRIAVTAVDTGPRPEA